MAEDKKTATRLTAAQVKDEVDILADRVEALANGVGLQAKSLADLTDNIGLLVEHISEQRAAQVLSEGKAQYAAQQELAEEAPKKRKTPVGERNGDVVVRNLHTRSVRVRIGKETDPYRINLAPRGQKGDTMAVPASLRGDLNYKNNLGVAFQEISQEDADNLRTKRRSARRENEYQKVRDQRTVTQDADTTVSRKVDTTPEAELSRVGPRYKDVPGSRNPSNVLDPNDLGWADAESDPEYRAFLQYKAQQQAARQSGQDFPEAPTRGRDPVEKALHSDDKEATAMARYIRKLEGGGRAGPSETGVIPKGSLSLPVRVEHATVSVQPHRPI